MRHWRVLKATAAVACFWCFVGPLTAQTVAPARQSAPAASDSFGFTAWLNQLRALNGVGPVAFDPTLANWAQQNNYAQASRGMGHWVMGPARRQNAGVGPQAGVWSGWLGSPPHLAALMDPTIRVIGIASYGAYWTFSAY